jgi:hypothetical protein
MNKKLKKKNHQEEETQVVSIDYIFNVTKGRNAADCPDRQKKNQERSNEN